MHELSIAQSIVDIIRQYVSDAQEPDVRAVRIRVGQMSGVVADSLEFCFGAIVQGTSLSGASLGIEETPLQSKCIGCGETFAVEGTSFQCPKCGSGEVQVISGTELQVVEIELMERQAGVI